MSDQVGTNTDEYFNFEDVHEAVVEIQEQLLKLQSLLPVGIGHNNPPDDAAINVNELKSLELLLDQVSELDEENYELNAGLFNKASDASIKFGNNVIGYSKTLGDAFFIEAAKSAGAETGKWAVRGLSILIIGQAILAFGEKLARFAMGLF